MSTADVPPAKKAKETENLDELLLTAARGDNLEEVKKLVNDGADPTHQEESSGESCLMSAAANGNSDMIEFLLENGAVWNALDRKHQCAGDHAVNAKQQVNLDRFFNRNFLTRNFYQLSTDV